MRVPSGYESLRAAGAIVVARPEAATFTANAVETSRSLYRFAAANAKDTKVGRTTAQVIDAPGGTWVVRHYVRGGAVAIMGDRYLRFGQRRPLRELWVSAFARACGVQTPAIAAVVVYPLGPFYTGDIATDLVPDAETLADLTFGEERRPPGQRTHAWNAAGRAIRAAARAGIVHADLNLRNVLVAWRSGVPSPYLLDLDRCRIVRRASPHDLAVMSRRLRRSAQRFEERTGLRLVNEFAAFEDGFRA